jgi:hypothetical protein
MRGAVERRIGRRGLIRAAILHVLRKINVGPDRPPNLDLLADRRRTGCARARTRQVATHQLLGGIDEARIVGRRRGHECFRGPVGRTCGCHPAIARIASRTSASVLNEAYAQYRRSGYRGAYRGVYYRGGYRRAYYAPRGVYRRTYRRAYRRAAYYPSSYYGYTYPSAYYGGRGGL